MDRKKVVITVNTSRNLFYYTGYIISEDSDWVVFNDEKEGQIKISKANIIMIREVETE